MTPFIPLEQACKTAQKPMAGEVEATGLSGAPAAVVLLNGHVDIYLLNIYVYTHRICNPLNLVREACFFFFSFYLQS